MVLFPSPKPMHAVVRPAVDAAHPTRCVVVFLPGFGDDARTFDEHGFPDALRARGLAVDTVSAGATFGYYANRSLRVRLREDVMRPIRGKGYQEVWILGISMGGLGAVLLARDQEPNVAGVFLLSPYLGPGSLQREIVQAGGLARWDPGPSSNDDYRELWRYLQRITRSPEGPPALYLGAGDQDEHRSPGPHPLAEAIPQDHRFHTPGGHDWGPWAVLWAEFLDRPEFRAHCATPQ